MTFKKFSGPDGNLKAAEELANEQWTPLMAAMTLCHSVVVTLDGKFAASSPGTIVLGNSWDCFLHFLHHQRKKSFKDCFAGI